MNVCATLFCGSVIGKCAKNFHHLFIVRFPPVFCAVCEGDDAGIITLEGYKVPVRVIVIGADDDRAFGDGCCLFDKSCPADAKRVNIEKVNIALCCVFRIKADAI